MSPSIWQILLVVVLAVLLFGRGKISSLMGDVAKGINAFKKGMKDGVDEEAAEREEPKALEREAKGPSIDAHASESKGGAQS